ncbi:MAG: class I SAM-dependent RNA methyltransferase [Pseudomonadota bacterium]
MKIEKMAAGGLGLGRLDGRIVFLPGVLPGEMVEVEVLETKSDYLRARPVEVLEPHPDRVVPPCRLFMVCGGCQFMHAAYARQLELKVGAALEKVLAYSAGQPELVPSPFPLFYRDRVRLQLSPVRGNLAPGFFSAGTRCLVPVSFCHQLHPRLDLPALADWMAPLARFDNPPTEMEVLMGTPREGAVIVLDFPQKPSPGQMDLVAAGPELKNSRRVFISVKGRLAGKADQPAGPGVQWLRMDDLGLKLEAWPGAFTQVNPAINLLLVRKVLEEALARSPKNVLDLFSGLGNFTLPLAKAGMRVTGVESNPAAAANAIYNARINGVRNARLFRADAQAAVTELSKKGEKFDLVVLDPPRAGAKGLALALARLEPRTVFYISCHPAAMARDLAEFASLGYSLKKTAAFDMFPQTSHLEILACLER